MSDINPLKIDYSVLNKSWEHYKRHMIKEDGRPVAEPDRGDVDRDKDTKEEVTYSETVAYVLLRAVYMEDKKTFGRVWTWAKKNMQRNQIQQTYTRSDEELKDSIFYTNRKWVPDKNPVPAEFNDHLFAWRWIPTLDRDGRGGIINYLDPEEKMNYSGINGASDDLEIAAALVMASYMDWGDNYAVEAHNILKDSWEKYVVEVEGEPYLFAGDQFSWSGEINPSYFRPAYFSTIFPEIDKSNPWSKLSETSYRIIYESGAPGANLVPNWVAMTPWNTLTESRTFPGAAGSIFGRDAFRSLWAVAQDHIYTNSNSARAYLTDCTVGPLCSLSKNINPERFSPTAFYHDGNPIRHYKVDPKFSQTWGLNREQLAMYGAMLPYFHYAGNKQMAGRIYRRLENAYDTKGYWGKDDKDYFIQTWVPFGLMLIRGLPEKVQNKINLIRRDNETKQKVEQALRAHIPPSYLLTADPAVGSRKGNDLRAVLSRELVNERLSIEQISAALEIITRHASSPLFPEAAKGSSRLKALHELDKKYPVKLLAYFADFREYGNNAILLLSVLGQKLAEQNAVNSLPRAIGHCRALRSWIDIQSRTDAQNRFQYSPHRYSRSILDLTEADLRAQATKKEAGFYAEGIGLAASSIHAMLEIDPKEAAPDYYVILRALTVIGDLYIRLHEEHDRQATVFSGEYLDAASRFYNYVASASEGAEIEEKDLDLAFYIDAGTARKALAFNLSKNHLTPSEALDAEDALIYMQGVAVAKDTSILFRRNGEKGIDAVLSAIGRCDEALALLEPNSRAEEDFFISYARNLKADLFLFLADRVKYYLWPENGSDLSSSSRELAEIEALFVPASPAADAGRESITRRITRLNDLIVMRALEIYRAVPPEFDFIYASSVIKQTEIAVRNTDFMHKEFSYLLPFYTHPVFTRKNTIPENEFLGVEMNYLKALLLVSSKQEENIDQAISLLRRVIINSNHLWPPYSTYFELHAMLKLAKITAQKGNKKEAGKMFAAIIQKFKGLSNKDFDEMAWRPASFLAELYHEWANLRLPGYLDKAKNALTNCYLSDSRYDRADRIYSIRSSFKSLNEGQIIKRHEKELQRKYGRID